MKIPQGQFTSLAKSIMDTKEKIIFLKHQEESLTKELRALCGDSSFHCDGYYLSVEERLGSIQYKDIPELKTVNLDEYRSEPIKICRLTYMKQFDI